MCEIRGWGVDLELPGKEFGKGLFQVDGKLLEGVMHVLIVLIIDNGFKNTTWLLFGKQTGGGWGGGSRETREKAVAVICL